MIAVACVYLGLITAVLGVISLLYPLRFLGIPTRGRGAGAIFGGLCLIALGWALPAPVTRVAVARTHLDRFAPAYQFSEFHQLRIAAPPATVYAAMRQVTANEIRLFQTLTSIRRFGRDTPESILNAPESMPILDVATQTTFLTLADQPDREFVVGTVVAAPDGWTRARLRTPEDFVALTGPGFANATMNFRIEPDSGGGSLLTTETRVFATDPPTRRRFAAYWRVIYPGSALIRRSWLQAIRKRAEGLRPAFIPLPPGVSMDVASRGHRIPDLAGERPVDRTQR